MISDLEDRCVLNPPHGEVCIVGAGGAGILLAVTLAEAGMKVILLEGGGMQLEPSSQQLYQSDVTGLPYRGIHSGRFRTHGGTTTEWGGQILELDDIDFSHRAHVPGSGWPFEKSELRPYYAEAVRAEGLSDSLPGDAAGRRMLLERFDMEDLALGAEVELPFSRWCPQRNFAVLHKQALQDLQNVCAYLHANVVEILLNEHRDSISALQIRTLTGRELPVTADQFVFCMGGIETTRLLLQPATQGIFPWQSNGVLGKHFQDHISCDRIPVQIHSVPEASDYFGFVTSRGFQYQTKIQLAFWRQAEYETLNVAGSIGPYQEHHFDREQAAQTLRRVREGRSKLYCAELLRALPHTPGIVRNWLAHRLYDGVLAWRRTMLHVHCEQSPLSDSTITLSNDRDALGMLRSRVDWCISKQEIESIRTFVWAAGRLLREKGLAEVEPPPGFFSDDSVVLERCSDSNHHMGSTRMSILPNEGIVDPDLKLHGITNGYICSASVFPSCGFSNPTHTVFALALRLADRLVSLPREPRP